VTTLLQIKVLLIIVAMLIPQPYYYSIQVWCFPFSNATSIKFAIKFIHKGTYSKVSCLISNICYGGCTWTMFIFGVKVVKYYSLGSISTWTKWIIKFFQKLIRFCTFEFFFMIYYDIQDNPGQFSEIRAFFH
jgi:hypothetical protein